MRGAAVVLVTLTVAACGGRGATTPSSPPSTARAAPATPVGDPCTVVPRAGDHSLRVLARTPAVIVHVPEGLRAGVRVALVLGLHGAGQDARGFEGESGFTQVADEHHFVIAYPMSWRARGFWHYPDPDNPRSGLRYLRATLDAVARTQCVDRGRVLVTGISSGGRMTYAAGCELADRLLAIAPVSGGTRELPPCHPARPISILDTHGTSDQIVSYGVEQTVVVAPGGDSREFFGTPQFNAPENRILAAYPLNVAQACGEVDANGVPNGTTLCDAVKPGTVVPRSVPLVRNCANGVCALYQWIQGTSMASPHAVGVAALIVAEKGKRDRANGGVTLSPDKVEQVLRRTATDTPCPAQEPFVYPSNPGAFDATCVGTPAFNGFYGDGIVNALAASKSGGGAGH